MVNTKHDTGGYDRSCYQREIFDGNALYVVNALFVVLAILGVVTDPTTEGVADSTQALTYTEPKKKGE